MQEIKMKFNSCFEKDTINRKTLLFKTEDGAILGSVTLRQLNLDEVAEVQGKEGLEFLLKSIESWDFKDEKGQVLEITLENLKSLTYSKKVDERYELGILNHLLRAASDMTFVSEPEEKNSERQ
jgi:hypothetical protein